jgi:hypothetical protein
MRYDREMLRRTVEARLFDAVLVVLAAAGCQRPGPSEPVHPQPRAPAAPDPWGSTAVGEEDTVVADVTVDPPPAPAPAPPPGAADAAKAKQICDRHKSTHKLVNPPPRPKSQPTQPANAQELATWDADKQLARCTIVRDRIETQFKVWVTPGETRCCPPDDCSNRGAPQPYEADMPGTYTLLEHAEVAADGTIVSSSARWAAQWRVPHFPPLSEQPYCGRRPEGLAFEGEVSCVSVVGAALAEMAELEAASVPAFERLARELEAHGAPAELARRARAAMRDEIRHAKTMARLAARYGTVPRTPTVSPLPIRSLHAIALENAVEGCVHEAFGALVASYQAVRARPDLRGAFAAIARDERRHAALAEAVHAWCIGALDVASRDEVVRARAHAIDALRARLARHAACTALGVPGADDARALCDVYFAAA